MKKIFLIFILLFLLSDIGFSQTKSSQIRTFADVMFRTFHNTKTTGIVSLISVVGSDTTFINSNGRNINIVADSVSINGIIISDVGESPGGGSSEWIRDTIKTDYIYPNNPFTDTVVVGDTVHDGAIFTVAGRVSFRTGVSSMQIGKNTNGGTNGSIAIGEDACRYNTGNYNVAIGYKALESIGGSTGGNNTALGWETLKSITSGTGNVAVGQEAMEFTTSGTDNVAIGRWANINNQSGVQNVAIGHQAMGATLGIDQDYSVGIGYQTLSNNEADYNTAIGYQAALRNTTGTGITAIGARAGYTTGSGNGNTYIGKEAGFKNYYGAYNVYIGYFAGWNSYRANDNVNIGSYAGYGNKEGHKNVFIGRQAAHIGDTLNNNVFIGYKSGYYGDSENNTFIGYQSGYDNKGDRNIAIGYDVEVGNTAAQSDTLNIGNIIHGDMANGEVYINDILILIPRAAAPTSPAHSMIYSNSTDNHLYFYDGTIWKQLD